MATRYTLVRNSLEKIVYDIQRLPGGYVFWQSLPTQGKRSTKALLRRWTNHLLHTIFTNDFRTIALSTCLDESNTIRESAKPLYNWLVLNLYNGKESDLYNDWFVLKG